MEEQEVSTHYVFREVWKGPKAILINRSDMSWECIEEGQNSVKQQQSHHLSWQCMAPPSAAFTDLSSVDWARTKHSI